MSTQSTQGKVLSYSIWIHKPQHWLVWNYEPSYHMHCIYESWFGKQTALLFELWAAVLVWIIYKPYLNVHTVFMSHNPALLYKALTPMFWLISHIIAQRGFIIHTIVHFPIPLLLFVLYVLKIHTQQICVSSTMNAEITSFVKVYKQLFCLVWRKKPLYIWAASLSVRLMCWTQFTPLCRCM